MVLNSITIVGTKFYQLLPVNVTVVQTIKTAASVNTGKVNKKGAWRMRSIHTLIRIEYLTTTLIRTENKTLNSTIKHHSKRLT